METRTRLRRAAWAAALLSAPAALSAHPSFTGYSGAPGTPGTCAYACHSQPGGSLKVTGFPAAYEPGRAYAITLGHDGGASVTQFNASVRFDTGEAVAGLLAAGAGTATYTASAEGNGIHLSVAYQDSASFVWTAPAQGNLPATLYLAGLQGPKNGLSTALTLVSRPQAGAILFPAPRYPATPGIRLGPLASALRPDGQGYDLRGRRFYPIPGPAPRVHP